MSVVLAEAVDRAVTAALAQENGRIEELIRAALDRQLAELVAAELEARTEGAAAEIFPTSGRFENVPTSGGRDKTCKDCAETKPTTMFERGRAICRDCRRAQRREPRSHRATGAEDRTGDPPQPASHPGGPAPHNGP